MATVATRREKSLSQKKNTDFNLTPTGLLMEGENAVNQMGLLLGDLCRTIAGSRFALAVG